VITYVVVIEIKARQHPLSGSIKIYELRAPSAAVEGATPYRYSLLERELPKRNRTIITSGTGIVGFLQSLPLIGRFMPTDSAIKRLIVTSPDKNYSTVGKARVRIEYRGDSPQTVDLEPGQSAVPLHMGYYIEKDPRSGGSRWEEGLLEEGAPGQFS
jgi:hypothetical protein